MPIALYALWFFTYNRDPTFQGERRFPPDLRYMFEAAAGAMGGLSRSSRSAVRRPGAPIARLKAAVYLVTALSVLIVVWLVAVRRRVTARLAMLIVTLASNWALLAITRA